MTLTILSAPVTAAGQTGPGPYSATDNRGSFAAFIRGERSVGTVEYVTSAVGSTRGNHYHERGTEHLYVATGRIRLLVLDVSDQRADPTEIEQVLLHAGTLAVIPPFVAHAIEALEQSVLVAVGENADTIADRIPYKLVG